MVDLNLEKEFENFEPPKRTPAQKKASKEQLEKRQQKHQRGEFERLYKKHGSVLNKMYTPTHGRAGRIRNDASTQYGLGKFLEENYYSDGAGGLNKKSVPDLSPMDALRLLRAIESAKRDNPSITYAELKEKIKGPAPKLKAKYGGKVHRGRIAAGNKD
tara:strand:- start:6817 stop:7293 length:477 start_codon:yes stop_codon:yes gene_type:complete